MRARQELIRTASGEGTFLGRLPDAARERILADAGVIETRRGEIIFSADEASDRIGIVADGMVRTYLSSSDGRRLTVRYARPGAIVGSITASGTALGVQAMSDSKMLELHMGTLQQAMLDDGRVGLLLIAEVGLRLRDTYTTLASNTFGSMRERVARHILDLAIDEPDGAGMTTATTQQGLADSVGTVREVVARVLRAFREEGLIATTPGSIRILDVERLAAIVGRDDRDDIG